MSLIDDALKRAHGTESPEDAVKRGASYPFMARNLQDRRRSRRALLTGFLAGGFLAAGLAGALVYLLVGWRPAPAGRVLAPARSLPHPAASSPLPEVVVKPPVGSRPPSAKLSAKPTSPPAPLSTPASPGPGGPPSPASGEGSRGDSSPRLNARGRSEPVQSTRPRGGGRKAGGEVGSGRPSRTRIANGEPSVESPVAADVKTYSKIATLPDGRKLELDGIVYSDTNPVAMINGHVVAVGGIIEGLTVAGIEAERVELKGNGLDLFVTLK